MPVKELASTLDTAALEQLSVELGGMVADGGRSTMKSLSKALTTFFILLSIGEEIELPCFLENDWTDLGLPITSETPLFSLQIGVSARLLDKFKTAQWSFLPPDFSKLGEHLNLDEHAVLPFLKVSEMTARKSILREVVILCVEIHPLYQPIHHPDEVSSSLRSLH
jgi:hypothetical protein